MPDPKGGGSYGPGAILGLIRGGQAVTRAQIMEATGLSRSTVAQRLELLLAAKLISAAGAENSTGGRPPGAFQINPDAGVVLIAAIGAASMQIALADMQGRVLAHDETEMAVAQGPERVLGEVARRFEDLLHETRHTSMEVKGIGIGVPGPVEFAQGRVVRPPIMTGWDNYRVPDFFADRYACPVVVDKDVNLMTLGEHRAAWPEVQHLLFVKVSTGIGSSIIMDGVLQRGAQGAAGDLGHLYVGNMQPGEPPLCRCGNYGCLEAYAAGWAICRRLGERHHRVESVRDVVALLNRGEADALEEMRRAGRLIGETIAMAVSLLNPSLVILGGDLALGQSHMLAAVRETVYRRSLPLATRNVQIINSTLGREASLIGAVQLVSDALFAPSAVDRLVGVSTEVSRD
ncbi:ROK family protein [Paraburkholderia sp.]|uniref:ROK family transcriptional regulator n=1 Tax=Paraburkholderia sp. TaxID=1926495 RepID=UPI0039E6FF2B